MNRILIYIILSSCWFSCSDRSERSLYFPVEPKKMVVLDSLLHPWSIAFMNEKDVLITEKDRNLIIANLETKQRTKLKGFPDDLADSIRVTDFRDNSGLFDVILHPQFEKNNLIYVSYAAKSDKGTTTKKNRANLKNDTLTNIQEIFLASPFRRDLFHYGGGMTFGRDGKLYFTIGERFYNEIDQPELPVAQNLNDKRGKVHRLNDDGTIPDDNPILLGEEKSSIYALGIRAAQGITLNQETGQIWFSEHGSVQGDELNILGPAANYGWPIKTFGKYRNPGFKPPIMEDVEFTEPKHYWFQTIAPTGLTFYNGNEFPTWKGDIILSGLSRGSLWRINLESSDVVSVEELFVNDRVRSRKVITSPSGKLYMLTDEPNGKLIEIKNAAANKVQNAHSR